MDDRIVTSSRAEYVGFDMLGGTAMAMWTGSEFVVGVRWTDGCFLICLGPFALGFCWQNEE